MKVMCLRATALSRERKRLECLVVMRRKLNYLDLFAGASLPSIKAGEGMLSFSLNGAKNSSFNSEMN